MSEALRRAAGLALDALWGRKERRLRAVPRFLLQRAVLAALVLGARFVLMGASLPHGSAGLALEFLGVALGMAASVWVAARLLDRRPFRDFGFSGGREWWIDLSFGLALGAVLMSSVFLVEWWLGWVVVVETFRTVDHGRPFALALATPVAVFVCIGFYEELDSRGYQLRNLAEALRGGRIGPRRAVALAWIVTSGVFGLLHGRNPHATLLSSGAVALAGLDLGLGYVLTGRLAIPIGLHVTWNLFQGSVFGFPVSGTSFGDAAVFAIRQGGPDPWTGGDFGPEAGILGVASDVVGMGLTLLWVRWRAGAIRFDASLAEYRPRLAPSA